jgi:hypothetical protein
VNKFEFQDMQAKANRSRRLELNGKFKHKTPNVHRAAVWYAWAVERGNEANYQARSWRMEGLQEMLERGEKFGLDYITARRISRAGAQPQRHRMWRIMEGIEKPPTRRTRIKNSRRSGHVLCDTKRLKGGMSSVESYDIGLKARELRLAHEAYNAPIQAKIDVLPNVAWHERDLLTRMLKTVAHDEIVEIIIAQHYPQYLAEYKAHPLNGERMTLERMFARFIA